MRSTVVVTLKSSISKVAKNLTPPPEPAGVLPALYHSLPRIRVQGIKFQKSLATVCRQKAVLLLRRKFFS
jgi:hypothetical protein